MQHLLMYSAIDLARSLCDLLLRSHFPANDCSRGMEFVRPQSGGERTK